MIELDNDPIPSHPIPSHPIPSRPAQCRIAGLVCATLFLACGPKPDTEAEETCDRCNANNLESIKCTLELNGLHADKEQIACTTDNTPTTMAQACDDACTNFPGPGTCIGQASAPATFVCHDDGDAYATEGLPEFGTSGSDGADETAAEPVWEPEKYAYYDTLEGHYVVEAEFVDALRAEPRLLLLDGVSLSYQTAGGFVFDGITTGCLMDVLGLEDGDVPLTVNSYDVTTIDGVLTARTALDSATSLTVVVQRSGTPTTLEYSIE